MAVLEERIEDGVAVLTLDRPTRRNALSTELIAALHGALERAEADDTVRAVVIAGNGPVFCAGGDLAGGLGGGEGLVDGEAGRRAYGALLARIPRMRRPVVAAVHGDALGGGLGLVAACDLVVVDPAARLGTPEVKVGLFPFVITAALQRVAPRKPLLEMMLTGSTIDAETARSWGLVNRVSAPGEALSGAMDLARTLASRSRAILGLGKSAFYRAAELSYEDALDYLNGRLTVNLLTEDAAEGIAAFLERRAPEWSDR